MPRRTKNRRTNRSDAALQALISELEDFSEELDGFNPEEAELQLDKHISSLIKAGHTATAFGAPDLEDVIVDVLGDKVPPGLVESASEVRTLLSTYVEPPTEEAIEEARSTVNDIVETLKTLTTPTQ